MKPDWLPREIFVPASEEEREAVRTAQRALRTPETGELDTATRAALRGVQRVFGLPDTGVLDSASAALLDRLRPPSLRE